MAFFRNKSKALMVYHLVVVLTPSLYRLQIIIETSVGEITIAKHIPQENTFLLI